MYQCETPEYRAWADAKYRCFNPNAADYYKYGGRGITMCDEWRNDFDAFLEHIGPRPSAKHSLDRVDNERGYEPGNVRWATKSQQNINRRLPAPDPRREKAIQLRESGLSQRAIATSLGVSHPTIGRWTNGVCGSKVST